MPPATGVWWPGIIAASGVVASSAQTPLTWQLHLCMNRTLFLHVDIFRECTADELSAIVMMLEHEFAWKVCISSSRVCVEGMHILE